MSIAHPLEPVEILKVDAEAQKAKAEAELARTRRELEAVILRQRLAEEADIMASDYENLVYVFNTEVSDVSVKAARNCLMAWHRRFPDAPMEIVFSSPGGSVFAGYALFDLMRFLSRSGHHITTVAQGYAASMAGVLLQAGDTRVIGAESYLMIHEVSSMALGKSSELGDAAELAKRLTRQSAEVYARRANMTADEIEDRMLRRNWWIGAEEALRLGFVDEIR